MTRPIAPPGKFLVLVPGFTLENFQMKKASRNCDARNETPASTIVSAYCSSIRGPWVEISSGKCQVFITMGIAEPIAISTIVTANIFAISLRLLARPASTFDRIAAAFDCGDYDSVELRTSIKLVLQSLFYFALKVKSAVPGLPAATVTFWVWVVCVRFGLSSCQAVTV